jgi:hypothetical protein
MSLYNCPVCGYDSLCEPPENDAICPSCGTHFGYHDFSNSPAELRAVWIAEGATWHSNVVPAPVGWSAMKQLLQAEFSGDAVGLIRFDAPSVTRVPEIKFLGPLTQSVPQFSIAGELVAA